MKRDRQQFGEFLCVLIGLLYLLVRPVLLFGANGDKLWLSDGVVVEETRDRINFDAILDAKSPASLPPGCSADWLVTVKEDLRRSEYRITWQEKAGLPGLSGCYQAPNRAQDLRIYFTPAGIQIIRRTTSEPVWKWGMSLTAYGWIEKAMPVQNARQVIDRNRMEYQRGNLTEWYVNTENGLEQGFTLIAPPLDNKLTSHEITLEMTITGDLSGRLLNNGQAMKFFTAEGVSVIRYDRLHIIDATGRELTGRFLLQGDRLAVVLDTTDAVFPITIDPMITGLSSSPDWTAEGGDAFGHFGNSLGTAGDVNGDGYSDVIIGASWFDQAGAPFAGEVRIYHGSATGLSTTANWEIRGDQIQGHLGGSVGTAGDVNGDGYADIIVGAGSYDNGQVNEGMAFVYYGSSTGMDQNGTRPIGFPSNADWSREGNQEGAGFGSSVATAGDVNGDGYSDVIVGAYAYDHGQTDEGAAFVYYGSATGLGTAIVWNCEGDQEGAGFGSSVATAGDVNGDGYSDIIVAAPNYDNGQTDEGKVFVYYGSASGLSSTADWTIESNQADALMGASGTAGDVNGDGYADVIVGAPNYASAGRSWVYHGSATGLSTLPSWLAIGQVSSYFGGSVGTAGDVNGDGYADIIVNATNYNDGSGNVGRIYVYYGSASGSSSTANWTVDGEQSSAGFGGTTAGDVNGDGYSDVIAGAPLYDLVGVLDDEGKAYLYLGGFDGLSTSQPNWTAESDQADARLGISVGSAGDVNGDGCSDVIIAADQYDNGELNEGMVFVYYGSTSGLGTSGTPANADWTAEGNQASANFGRSCGSAGDVNGDGFSDIIIGAWQYDHGQTNEGMAFVYYGSASGLGTNGTPDNADWTAEADQENAYFGLQVGTAGDVNGDGFGDVIIGADGYNGGESGEGRVFVYHGTASGLSSTTDWTAESNQAGAMFGFAAGTAGDVNGDGFSDIIIGASMYDNGQTNEGGVFVYHGSAAGLGPSGTPANADWTAESNQANAWFGYAVGSAGDVNGDGYCDVIIGAHQHDNSETNEGLALVYHGSASGLGPSGTPSNADWKFEPNTSQATLGRSVAGAGDVNGDGFCDVIVGADGIDCCMLFYGSAFGLSAAADWWRQDSQSGSSFGYCVGSAGDVNGDGYADVIVGAINYDNPTSDEGQASVYYGNNRLGVSLKPQQRRVDNSALIALLGASESNDSFRLALRGQTPYGRGKVKLEWEVKPFGTLFDGIGTGKSSSWLDTGAAGITINQMVSGLSPFTLYHWRIRLLYHQAQIPFQQYSRWITIPYNGWQEADLRTAWVCLLRADLTGDCHVTLVDLSEFCIQWLESGNPLKCPWSGDLTGVDCEVNLRDFEILAEEWLE